MDECGWMLSLADLAVKGNPAAVCLLEEERDDRWLQAATSEFNLYETCYLTQLIDSDTAPRFGVELCGHATLAASYTLFKSGLIFSDIIEFSTLSGILTAKKVLDVKTANDEAQESSYFIELHFPAAPSNEFNSDEVSVYLHALNGAFLLMKGGQLSQVYLHALNGAFLLMKEGGQLSQDDLLVGHAILLGTCIFGSILSVQSI
ncbi:uncharacterized protein [Malus domestica]|uniref:uncharacterized protein n=1 Tax=Malus domestica TaxID=3750 RepID=UPI00145FDABE